METIVINKKKTDNHGKSQCVTIFEALGRKLYLEVRKHSGLHQYDELFFKNKKNSNEFF